MFLTRSLSSPSRNLDPFAMLDELFAPVRPRVLGGALPLDLYEEDDTLHVELEMPGVLESDVELSVFEKQLHVRVRHEEQKPAEPSEESAAPQRRYFARERMASSQLERVLRLPYDVDADRVEAELHGGVLHVRLPKAESLKPRRIELKRANGA